MPATGPRITDMPLDGVNTAEKAPPSVAGFGTFAVASLLFTSAVVLLSGFVAPLSAGDGAYWALGLAVAGALSVSAGLRMFSGTSSPIAGGATLAVNALTGAFFLAVPGAVFAFGYDGLAYGLGLGAGALLMQLLIAPRFAQSNAASVAALIGKRFPGRTVELLVLSVITASMLLLLAAGLTAAGLVGVRLLGVDFAPATIAAACAVLACFVLRGAGGSSIVNGLLYALLFAALFIPLLLVSAQWYGLPVPEIAYANSIWQLQGIEESLLEQELADPGFMKPLMTPFLALTPLNFVGIILGLAAGVAVLPSLLFPPIAETSARKARHTTAWGLGFVALLLTLAPAIATFVRQTIATLIADRTPITDLPGWIFVYGKLGLVQVCGVAARSAAEVAQACAALPEASTALRLHDIAIDPDVVTLALPEILGLHGALTGLIAVTALAAVLATAHAPLSAIVCGLGLKADGLSPNEARGARFASYVVAAAVTAGAAFVALLRPAGIVELATASAVIAAAGLFPVVIAALWWPRANAWGAAAGILAGLGAMLLYYAGRHYFPVPFVDWAGHLSGGGANGLQYFDELKDTWLAAEAGADKDAALAALAAHARSIADLWGISGPATVLLALPAGFIVLLAVSLLTPAQRPKETTP